MSTFLPPGKISGDARNKISALNCNCFLNLTSETFWTKVLPKGDKDKIETFCVDLAVLLYFKLKVILQKPACKLRTFT